MPSGNEPLYSTVGVGLPTHRTIPNRNREASKTHFSVFSVLFVENFTLVFERGRREGVSGIAGASTVRAATTNLLSRLIDRQTVART